MPKIVDHDARRDKVAEATWRVMAERGIEAATIREIAKETGYSTGMLVHYFKDKDELLLYAIRLASMRMGARMWYKGGEATGTQVLRNVLLSALPIDEERQLEWHIWVIFWCKSLNNPSMAEEQRHWYVEYRSFVRGLLVDGQRNGYYRSDLDAAREADSLVAFVDGIGMQATLDPQRFPAEYLTSLLDRCLSSLT